MSLVLFGTTQSLTVTLGAATTTNPVVATASYADQTGLANSANANDITLNSTAAGTLVAAPAASVARVINSLSVYNADTVNTTVTVARLISATSYTLIKITLAPGYTLALGADGWQVLDTNGNLLTAFNLLPGLTIQIPNITGTVTGNNAPAGSVGEYLTAANSSGVALTTGTQTNILSLVLTPGDWDVWGGINFLGSGYNMTNAIGGLSTTSGVIPLNYQYFQLASSGNFFTIGGPVQQQRINVSVNTTIYLVGLASFTTGTVNAQAFISARRVR